MDKVALGADGMWYGNDLTSGLFIAVAWRGREAVRTVGRQGVHGFRGHHGAVDAAAGWLVDNYRMSAGEAGAFAVALGGTGQATASVSGLSVRILDAHLTVDGKPIVPGLLVTDYDRRDVAVDAFQFSAPAGSSLHPGGQFFDGWYYTAEDDGSIRGRMNGERLRTRR